MNKTITITVDVDGNSISREYKDDLGFMDGTVWAVRVMDMLDTIEKSNEEKF